MFPGTKNRNEGTFAKTTLLRNRPFQGSKNDRVWEFQTDVAWFEG